MITGIAIALAARWGISRLVAYLIMGGVVLGAIAALWLTWALIKRHYYNQGVYAERAIWVAKQYEAEIARLKLEIEIAKQTAETDATVTAILNVDIEAHEKLISELRDKLRKSGNRCLIGDDWRGLQ